MMRTDLEYALKNRAILEKESYDIEALKLLSKGNTVEEISVVFKIQNTSPSGVSSIEKRIGKFKIYFKATNNVHLISISKDLGLI